MKRLRHKMIIPGILIVGMGLMMLSNLSQVPFHPDEVSLLYQSRDFEKFLEDPLSLAYDPGSLDDADQVYRLMNPPLTKYILAIGRKLAGYGVESVSVDWDWSSTWAENQDADALPAAKLLTASRTASTFMVILSMVLLYLCATRIHSPSLGLLAILLLGSNALVLLHGRRAMAEGPLLFGITLALFGILEADEQPWLAGIGAAIAICTKLSAGALAPIALLAVIWSPSTKNSRAIIKRASVFLLSLVLVYLLFNPVIWRDPIQTIETQWTERTKFIQGMQEEFEQRGSSQVLNDPSDRLAALLAQLFISGPQYAEAGNYLKETSATHEVYDALATSSLFRGFFWGGVFLTISLLGGILWIMDFNNQNPGRKRKSVLLLLSTLSLSIALLWVIPLPFQRYYIPLVPFQCIWIGYGLLQIFHKTQQTALRLRRSANGNP